VYVVVYDSINIRDYLVLVVDVIILSYRSLDSWNCFFECVIWWYCQLL